MNALFRESSRKRSETRSATRHSLQELLFHLPCIIPALVYVLLRKNGIFYVINLALTLVKMFANSGNVSNVELTAAFPVSLFLTPPPKACVTLFID